jgi:uncharacterized protein
VQVGRPDEEEEEAAMAIIALVTLRGVTQDQYDALRAATGWLEHAPDGGLAHLTWWEGDDCHSLGAWESEAAFTEFTERRLGPGMAAAGLDVVPEVTLRAAHEVFTPQAEAVAPTVPAGSEQDDVAVLRRGYAAFAALDMPSVLGLFDPEITWETSDSVPLGGRFVGPEQVAGFLARLPENYAEFHTEPEQFIGSGGTVAVVGRHRGRSAAGTAFDVPWVHVWTLRQGRVTSFTEHTDTAKLNTALGTAALGTAAPAAHA